VKKCFLVSENAEISLECNPATADIDDFKLLKKSGFNRLSMGLQSAHNEELQALGRIHTFEDFEKTFSAARTAGFENINLDLMYGIPLQTEESFRKTLETVLSYSPEHISAYALKIEPNTLFFKNKDSLILPDEDSEYNMYKLASMILGENGYDHYEISNYAKGGYESRHNLKYWNCDDYIGFGVSAHSCIGWDRYAITSSICEYIDLMSDGNPDDGFVLVESLSKEEFSEEYIMMRMRLGEGLSLMGYKEKFSAKIPDKYIKRMSSFINSGHIISNNGHYSFSGDGMYLSNYLLSEILDLE
jgi:oxygen-independent coproporphyrinogen-3 oxidase